MTALEFLIRPFQTRDISPPRQVIKPNSEPVDDIVLIFGGEGETKTFSGSHNETVSTYQDATIKEQERKTSPKTITSPDDPEQKLDVDLIDKMTTKQGYGRTFQKSTFKFNNEDK